MVIEILKRERDALRKYARRCNRYHERSGGIGVRTWNTLRKCASLTVAILALKHCGLT